MKYSLLTDLQEARQEQLIKKFEFAHDYITTNTPLILDYGLYSYELEDILREIISCHISDLIISITLTTENKTSEAMKKIIRAIYAHTYHIRRNHPHIKIHFNGTASLSWVINDFPKRVTIEPTNICQLRCPECRHGITKQGYMDLEVFKGIVRQFNEIDKLLLYIRGESLLHPDIMEFFSFAKQNGVKATEISTNLSIKNDELIKKLAFAGIDRFIVSIDGATKETYNVFRIGGDFDLVVSNVRKIKAWNPDCKIIIQFIPNKKNEHEIPRVHKLAQHLGADVLRIRILNLFDKSLLPENPKFRYEIINRDITAVNWDEITTKNFICPSAMNAMIIKWNGELYPCCFMEGGGKDIMKYNPDLGPKNFTFNIFQKSLNEIWLDENYFKLRYSFLEDNPFPVCKFCQNEKLSSPCGSEINLK